MSTQSVRRNGSAPAPWVGKVRRLLGETDGRLPDGALREAARGTGLTYKQVCNALVHGHAPRNEGEMALAFADYLEVDGLDLLDPEGGWPVRKAGDPLASAVRITAPRYRPLFLCAAHTKAHAELLKAARAICKRHGLK